MVFAPHTYSTGTIRIHHYHTPLPHTYMRNNARREEVRSSRRLFLVPLSPPPLTFSGPGSPRQQRPRLKRRVPVKARKKARLFATWGEGK